MIGSKPGFGITGSLDLVTVRAIAIRAEELGIHSLWVNDTPGGNSLERIAAAAEVTSRLVLATGVIPVDRKPASRIVDEARDLELPLDRLIIGIGSSAPPSPLARIEESLSMLRESLDVRTVVGSLGPRMRRLGAEKSNGLLFNWLTPRFARQTTATMRMEAEAAGNAPVQAATYIRTALGADARERLEAEAARYSAIPAYAANFERLGITAMESAVYGETADAIVAAVTEFGGAVDIAVVRAITAGDDLDHYLRLLDAIAPIAQPQDSTY